MAVSDRSGRKLLARSVYAENLVVDAEAIDAETEACGGVAGPIASEFRSI